MRRALSAATLVAIVLAALAASVDRIFFHCLSRDLHQFEVCTCSAEPGVFFFGGSDVFVFQLAQRCSFLQKITENSAVAWPAPCVPRSNG